VRVVDLPRLAGAAVVAVAAVGAVEPDGEQFAVLGEQFAQLVAVIGEVLRAAVILVMAIPGREVDAEADAVPLAGVADFADDVAFAAFPGAVLDRVFGELGRPEAESVVMFGGEDEALHAGLLGDTDDLVGVEVGGVEQRGDSSPYPHSLSVKVFTVK
jgi:hypothetical protein